MSTTPMTAAAIPTILCQVIGSSRNNTPSARPDAEGWRTCKPICLISLAFIKGLAVGVSLAKDTLGSSCRDGLVLDHPVVKFFGVFSRHPVILKAAFEEPYHDGVHHLARVGSARPGSWRDRHPGQPERRRRRSRRTSALSPAPFLWRRP